MITGYNLVGGVCETNPNATTYNTINPKTEEILPSSSVPDSAPHID